MRRAFFIACVIVLVLVMEDGFVHAKGKPNRPQAETDDEVPWGIARIGADKVWNRTRGDDVKVAILDTGVADHTDLIIADGINTVGPGTNGSYSDTQGHGTMIAGMIAALDNGEGVIGIGPDIDLYAVRFRAEMAHYQDANGRRPDLYEGMEWCVLGPDGEANTGDEMDVINMSFGVSEVELNDSGEVIDYWPLHDPEFYYWIHKANEAGIVMVAAAGSDRNRSIKPYYPPPPPAFPSPAGRYVDAALEYMFPASYPEVIAVSATGMRTAGEEGDRGDYFASFSHYGLAIELSAPGVNIRSTALGNGYGSGSGTSYSCAHVAGVAALLVAAGVSDVKGTLLSTAEDLGDPGPDEYFGYGLVDAEAAVSDSLSTLSLYTLSPKDKLSITWGNLKNRRW